MQRNKSVTYIMINIFSDFVENKICSSFASINKAQRECTWNIEILRIINDTLLLTI